MCFALRPPGRGQRRLAQYHWSGAAAIHRANSWLTRAVMPGPPRFEAGLGPDRAVHGDHEPGAATALDPDRDQRHIQPQGKLGRHQGRGGRDAEERDRRAAVVTLVHEEADAAPLPQLARQPARGLGHLEEAAAEGRAPPGHQRLEPGVALAPVDHGQRETQGRRMRSGGSIWHADGIGFPPREEEKAMLEALISKFAQIEDPRCDWRVEHKLLDILVIAVCAVIGEAESFEDIALYGRCKRDWLAASSSCRAAFPRTTPSAGC